jgi:hypothetical protein
MEERHKGKCGSEIWHAWLDTLCQLEDEGSDVHHGRGFGLSKHKEDYNRQTCGSYMGEAEGIPHNQRVETLSR